MTRQTRNRLFSLVLLLGVLGGILSTPAVRNADAAVCCEACQSLYDSCLAGTIYKACNGDQTCCFNRTQSCWPGCLTC